MVHFNKAGIFYGGLKMDEEVEKQTKNPDIEQARQHFKEAHAAMRQSMESLIPPGYRENRRKVRKEFLLGLRKLLDAAIEHAEKKSTSEK
jgi:hypothetical protein